ncbi:MAG: hypothetical protein HY826_14310, partial [Actinobacteria bacterium]|nr:hypothetical protein [Actinomycetota bacterium]
EARGADANGGRSTVIAGAAAPTADLASAVAAAVVFALIEHRLPGGVYSTADPELLSLDLLQRATALGVSVQEFTGVARATSW